MNLSRRAYARHRKAKGLPGVSETAVRKALADGRIELEFDGKIDPDKADRMWAATTEAAKQRDNDLISERRKRAWREDADDDLKPVPNEAASAVDRHAPDTGDSHTVTYAKSRAANEAIKAQMNELRLQALRGELVNRQDVETHVFDLARKERDSWLQFPARKSANMAAELGVDAHLMEQALDRYIRDHLTELAEVKIDIGGG